MKRKKEPFWNRLKEFEFKTWYIAIIVVIAILIRFWGENTITLLQKDVPIVTKTEISLEELTHYLTTRQQYIDDKIDIIPELKESYYLEDKLDKKIHEWFLVRQWRPKRFFYVERRLALILSLIHDQERKLDKAAQLKREASYLLRTNSSSDVDNSGKAADLNKQADDIRYYIDRDIRRAGISTKEEDIVRQYRRNLEPLMEGLEDDE